MAVMKFTPNRFSPLASAAKNSQNNPKTILINPNHASSSTSSSKGGTFWGPVTEDARKTKSLREMNGIPVLDLSAEAEELDDEGWTLRKGGKSIPVLSTIEEEKDLSGLLQFTPEDVQTKVEFRNNVVVCFIMGANPPWQIIEGYVYRVWEEFGIDRVSFLDNGMFIVRFQKSAGRDALLKAGYYLFDNKPVIIKPWSVDMELVKEKVDVVPVWVKLSGIPLKFWGKCLPSIAGLVGKFVQTDRDTFDKVRLSYARVLVELKMDQTLPDKVKFVDENGSVVSVSVDYEWRSVSCASCKGVGHDAEHCRKPGKFEGKRKTQGSKPQQQKVWRPKQQAPLITRETVVSPIIVTLLCVSSFVTS
ncbi:uncharacterized protein LOC141611891 [Silene latifolia]|uniref:uncharacterized protein LOC141611891 n=1 Tax=Silene latifolia TaxID=37657 RepID=UPI003D772F72